MRSVASLEFDTVTPRMFRRRYFDPGAPVAFRGFLRSWPAVRAWTPAAFAERFGTELVEPMHSTGPVRSDAGPYRPARPMPMKDFAVLVAIGTDSDLYLVAQSQMLRRPAFAELWNEMSFDPRWFDIRATATHVSLWMGPCGSVTPLHFDLQDVLLAQAYGRKRVLLAAPSQTARLYPHATGYSRVDPEQPDLAAYPRLGQVEFLEAILEHGDALFVPCRWWHHVRALTASISLSMSHFAWTRAVR